MALSVGFIRFVSSTNATHATGLLSGTPVGLPPTEHASLCWSHCLDKNLSHADFIDASIQHNSPLGHAYQNALDPFSRIHRRIDSTNRMYLRTLKVLQDLQTAAAESAKLVSQPDTPLPEPSSPMSIQPLTQPIGFVPQTAPTSAKPPHVSHENHEAPPGRTGILACPFSRS